MAIKNPNQIQIVAEWLDSHMSAKSKSKAPTPTKQPKPTKPTRAPKATKTPKPTTPTTLISIPPRIRLQVISSDTNANRILMAKLFATLNAHIEHTGDVDPWYVITLDQLLNITAAQ
jgi:cell division septation protein DedD